VPAWPSIGTVKEVISERNLRDIRKRGGEVERLFFKFQELVPQLPASAPRKLIVGQFSAAGAKVLGEGFSSEKTATGKYTVKFTSALATVPVVTLMHTGAGFSQNSVAAATKAEFKVESYNGVSFVAEDHALNFYALG